LSTVLPFLSKARNDLPSLLGLVSRAAPVKVMDRLAKEPMRHPPQICLGVGTNYADLRRRPVEVVLLCNDVSNDCPFGEPRPVQGSQPVPAENAPLLPLVTSKNGASPSW